MKSKIKLIEGKFSANEAKDLLIDLHESKIRFHELKNFQSKQRYDKEDAFAVSKIAFLKENIQTINEIMEEALKLNQTVKISSEIKIEFSDKKK